mgnify:CR=1 FL=1
MNSNAGGLMSDPCAFREAILTILNVVLYTDLL